MKRKISDQDSVTFEEKNEISMKSMRLSRKCPLILKQGLSPDSGQVTLTTQRNVAQEESSDTQHEHTRYGPTIWFVDRAFLGVDGEERHWGDLSVYKD